MSVCVSVCVSPTQISMPIHHYDITEPCPNMDIMPTYHYDITGPCPNLEFMPIHHYDTTEPCPNMEFMSIYHCDITEPCPNMGFMPIHQYDITEPCPNMELMPIHHCDITKPCPNMELMPIHHYDISTSQPNMDFIREANSVPLPCLLTRPACKVAKNDITITSRNVCLRAYQFAQVTDRQTHRQTHGRKFRTLLHSNWLTAFATSTGAWEENTVHFAYTLHIWACLFGHLCGVTPFHSRWHAQIWRSLMHRQTDRQTKQRFLAPPH